MDRAMGVPVLAEGEAHREADKKKAGQGEDERGGKIHRVKEKEDDACERVLWGMRGGVR